MGLIKGEMFAVTVILLLILMDSCASESNKFSARYGGGGSRFRQQASKPLQPNFVRVAIPSPTHAYPTYMRVPVPTHIPSAAYQVRFPTPVLNRYPVHHQPNNYISYHRPAHPTQHVPQQPVHQIMYQPQSTPIYYAPSNQVSAYPSPVYQATNQIPTYTYSTQQQQQPQGFIQSFQTPTQQGTVFVQSTPGSQSSAQAFTFVTKPQYYDTKTSSSHIHVKQDPVTSATTYEPCTNANWQPIAPIGGTTNFRYQTDSSNNRVVVLSRDVVQTLLANAPKTSSTSTSGLSDSSVSSSSSSVQVVAPTFVPSKSTGFKGEVQNVDSTSNLDPSIRLVGYIGAATDKTPPGYVQLPVTKTMLQQLGGRPLLNQVETNFQRNASSQGYSLFTLKSVNDVQSLMKLNQFEPLTSTPTESTLGLVVPNDQDTSGSSQTITTTMFYPNGNGKSTVQLVGHVAAASPDVKPHFTRRFDKN